LLIIRKIAVSNSLEPSVYARFYEPDHGADASDKLVRRSFCMNDRTLVMVMVNGIGAHVTNDEKRAHLIDLKQDHLIGQVCAQEILPPER
jgi:hypothetical protein